MRAVGFSTFGGPEVLRVLDLPLPEPDAGQVRIRVQASPVQPADVNARAGRFGPMLPPGQYVLGWDVAGTVDAVGSGVTGFAPGDPVVGLSDWLETRVGAQAELVVLDAQALAPAPAGLSLTEAATLPANALTAAGALDLTGLAPGQTLAVTGAAGAVGGYAVELARLRGVHVVGLASARDEQFLAERGARAVSRDRSPGDPAAALRAAVPDGADAVLDAADLGAAVLGAVRDQGVFVSLIPPATPEPERGIRVERARLRSDGKQLRELVALAEQGQLTVRVADTFPFAEAAAAHERFEQGGVRGRLVLQP